MEANMLEELQAIDDDSTNCRYCLKSFKTSKIRKRHEIIHTDRAFQCNLCSKRCSQKGHLKEHLEKVHQVLPVPVSQLKAHTVVSVPEMNEETKPFGELGPFGCKFCGRTFKTGRILSRHERMHTDPFICDYCNKEFGSKSHLKEHLMVHVQMINPYQKLKKGRNDAVKKVTETFHCSECRKYFYTKSDLKKHEKRVHLMSIQKGTKLGRLMQLYGNGEEQVYEMQEMNDEECKYEIDGVQIKQETEFVFDEYNNGETYEEETTGVYTCACSKTFRTFAALARHESVQHPNSFKETISAMRDLIAHLLSDIKPDEETLDDELQDFTDTLEAEMHEPLEELKIQEVTEETDLKQESKQLEYKRPYYSIARRRIENLQDLISKSVDVQCKCCACFVTALEYESHLLEIHPLENVKILKRDIDCFYCHCCRKGFETAYLCIKHLQKVDHQLTGDSCDICTLDFPDIVTLNEHRNAVHQGRQPTCEQCSQTFKNYRLLRFHMLKHKGMKAAYCKLCGSKFLNKEDLEQHQIIHDREPELVCADCGLTYKGRERLRQHMKNKHMRYKKLNIIETLTDCEDIPCPDCNLVIRGKDRLKRHMYKFHTEKEMKFECSECHKRFDTNSDLTKHSVVHSREVKFFCKECGRGFTRKQTLNRHERVHDDSTKTLRCTFCHKTFRSNSNLKRHLICHTGEKNEVCPECSTAFADRSCLNKHMERHHNMSLPGYNKKSGRP